MNFRSRAAVHVSEGDCLYGSNFGDWEGDSTPSNAHRRCVSDEKWRNCASVYFISPKDGDTVASPFKVQFGLTGMGVAPAGVDKPNTGHHHLIIDTTLSPAELKEPIASDAKHLHFGGGQTETMVTLPPGQHTLQLVLGDWSHVPFDPPIMWRLSPSR